MSSSRYPGRILGRLEYSRQFRKKAQISIFIKIRPVRVELFHADGQDEINSLF